MNILPTHLSGKLSHVQLHHRHVSDFTGAIAGLASTIAVVFGLVAARFAPHGIGKFAVALHLHQQPLIVRLSPIVATGAALIAAAAGLIRFYSWCRERREVLRRGAGDNRASDF
jgi:hypothetical protein